MCIGSFCIKSESVIAESLNAIQSSSVSLSHVSVAIIIPSLPFYFFFPSNGFVNAVAEFAAVCVVIGLGVAKLTRHLWDS